MAKTNYKNITYLTPYRLYRVHIMRNSQTFSAYFKDLDKAVDALAKVHEFYVAHKTLPTLRDLRLDSTHLDSNSNKNISFHNLSGLWRLCIYRNNRRFVAYSKTREEAVELRNKAIEFYRLNSRLPDRLEIDDSYKESHGERSNGLKHVTYNKSARKWRFRIVRNKVRLDAFFDTFEEAKLYRSRVLDYYKIHRQLPDKDSDF